MLHGDELAELLQSVNIADLIHEFNTAENTSSMPIRRNYMIFVTSIIVSIM